MNQSAIHNITLELKAIAEKFRDTSPELAAAGMSQEEKVRLATIALQSVAMLIGESIEFIIILLGALVLPAPLRWYILAIAPLGLVSYQVFKYAPASAYKVWKHLDHTYCVLVMLVGPFVLL